MVRFGKPPGSQDAKSRSGVLTLSDLIAHSGRLWWVIANESIEIRQMSDASPDVPIRFETALRAHQAGDWDGAEAAYLGILAVEPEHADCLHLLGVLDHQRGRFDKAAERILAAIRRCPDQAVYHNNLGVVYRVAGQPQAACDAYREAIRLEPRYPDALSNLGVILHETGDVHAALTQFDRALATDPDHVDALYGDGNLLASVGQHEAAIARFRRALDLAPQRGEILNNLGIALASVQKYGEAESAFRSLVARDATSVSGWANLGGVLESLGRLDEAAKALTMAARLEPDQHHWPIRIAALCPAIFSDRVAIERYRIGLEAILDANRVGIALPGDPATVAGVAPSFFLSHHGCCDRVLKEKYARLYRGNFPERDIRPGSGPIRVGFFANAPHHGGFLRVIGGIIERLAPGRFRPVVIGDMLAMPAMRAAIQRPDAEFLEISTVLPRAAEQIAGKRCDVLYHWQVGTDSFNYFLAHHRLAPVQCTSWGSHVTTGVPTIDYFLSTQWIEPADADDHYSETLVQFASFPTFEPRQAWSNPTASRAEFGLPAGRTLYMSLQRLAKFHPDFDSMLSDILLQDPTGLVIMLQDEQGHEATQLQARFAASIPDMKDRIVFLPRVPHEQYLRLLSLADVVLDPPYYSCGHTGYDALGLGLPMVTWPSRYNVGRYVLGYYRRLGMMDLIADSPEHYVSLAVRLGTDPLFRATMATRLASIVGSLYQDLDVVQEHEQFFERAVASIIKI